MRAHASVTAELVCLVRALESDRPQARRALHDPFASAFLSAPTRALRGAGRLGLDRGVDRLTRGLLTFVTARHAFLDAGIRAALDAGAAQLVILGAGYDARAWRLAPALAGRPVLEIDHPATSARKARLVAARGAGWPAVERRVVAADLQVEALAHALARGGYRPELPAVVAWEGVSMYLRAEAVRATLAVLARGAPGTRLLMDLWDPRPPREVDAALDRAGLHALRLLGEPLTFGLSPHEGPAFFAAAGFRVRDLAPADLLARRHVPDGRRVYPTVWCVDLEVGSAAGSR